MGLFEKPRAGGFMDEIRCDEASYLIWKWHPSRSEYGNNNRENAIRWGSSLRVKDGEVAVFVYNQDNGTQQDYIEGPADCILETNNLPALASIVGLAYEGGTPFQAELYFINLAQIIQVKFGVPFFDVYDPRFMDFGVPIAVRGTISFNITDYVSFIKLHRLSQFEVDDFQKQIRDAVVRYVKDTAANAPAAHNIPVIQIESKTAEINDVIEYDIGERLKENYGVTVSGVDIGAIEIDKMSDGYSQLLAVTRDVTTATVQAQTTANIKNIHDKQRIEAEDYEETLHIQREAEQYSQHKQTQTSNFAAYQTEAQTQVGVAGANALGQMGSNGAGSVDLGGNGAGFNPASMMVSMAVGGAIGQNIAGTMNSMMNGQSMAGSVPPPVPTVAYHVVVNGQATGPFGITALRQMVVAGTLTQDSHVWKQGMVDWEKANSVDEVNALFDGTMPPPIPTTK
ncbi:SPFH domain-Band 7 family protein [anaerobic digester metagenome]